MEQIQILVKVGSRIKTQMQNRYNRKTFVALATQISFDRYYIVNLGIVYGNIEEL